ncbi:MAG: hypothetical protein EOO06_11345 [Chitinophagaceae bacterium]|nr:MAG: hypothetical protein EOO06_11345 [Chitinophagaceae bacterium]
MRILFIFLLLSFHYINAHSQINERVDSLSIEICKTFKAMVKPLDSVTIIEGFTQHLRNYFSKMEPEAISQALDKINTRLQTTCDPYREYMTQFNSEHWRRVNKCPGPTISPKEVNEFFATDRFYYIESSGDTTMLHLTKDSWTDHLKGNTFSKLSLKRLSPLEFVISFKESNHPIKKNMSKVGDQYYYNLISKDKSSYLLCVSIKGLTTSSLFKLYPVEPETR